MNIPDFDRFVYKIAIRPPNAKLIAAWIKLEEAERRLAYYRWTESKNDPGTAQNRILLNDAVSALLLTFEATLQLVKNQIPKTNTGLPFDDWLKRLPENAVFVRGLRTLRHFDAHVEPKLLPRVVDLDINEKLSGNMTTTEISARWILPKLTASDLRKLRTPPLKDTDLAHWNKLVTDTDASTIFENGLANLKKILESAEATI